MTVFSQLLALYPAAIVLSAMASALWFIVSPNPWAIGLTLFILYLLPLLSFRIHKWLFPKTEGISYLVGGGYSPWWGGHQIQWVYIAFPVLERFLRLIPGLFSLWLRSWGSDIGRSVYWTPHLEITDRDLLEVGDQVIFGHRVGLYAHVIKPKNDNLMLFVRRIRIGQGAFIGAAARMGPGVRVETGALVPTASEHFPNSRVSACAPASDS